MIDEPIFVVGYPNECGGANTECWHTLKLWRSLGLDVHLIPTWEAPPDWLAKTEAIGCVTHEVTADSIGDVPGLQCGLVVSFCNENLWKIWDRWSQLDLRIVWVNCMTVINRFERMRGTLCDAYVFQSNYQRTMIEPGLAAFGYTTDRGHLIRGAFDVTEFPFVCNPHRRGTPFWIGRISRAAKDKFSRDTWKVYEAINYRPLRARVMGYNEEVAHKLGDTPCWAETLPEKIMSAQDFYRGIHCLVHLTGGSRENWPRCGLEAMASGVLIVAENNYGWREMVAHGKTGFLGNHFHEYAHWAAVVGMMSPDQQVEMAWQARKHVERLADPERIGGEWLALFQKLAKQKVMECASA